MKPSDIVESSTSLTLSRCNASGSAVWRPGEEPATQQMITSKSGRAAQVRPEDIPLADILKVERWCSLRIQGPTARAGGRLLMMYAKRRPCLQPTAQRRQ